MTGLEVLAWLRQVSGLPPLPVIVFSSSAHRGDVERAYHLDANAFIVKPSSVPDSAAANAALPFVSGVRVTERLVEAIHL